MVFSHGWPLSADAWDGQMLFLGQHGYRIIAHDQRSHGRSDQTWDGNDMDTYADDLAELIAALNLRDAVLAGHSTGGGEVAHYIREGTQVSEGVREAFWLQGMMGGIKGQYDCIRQFSEVDYTEDLKKMNVPTLIVHGDDDQFVSIAAAALRSSKIAPRATLKIYPGAPHGLSTTHRDQLNADLLAFVKG